MKGKMVFVLGGARSGKSAFALDQASKEPGRRGFVATAQAFDQEMKERIRRHQEERSEEWTTLEEPMDLAGLLRERGRDFDVVLIDCLTLWLSNLMLAGRSVDEEIKDFLSTLEECTASVYMVSNEVGLGIVPENELARKFRDAAGALNRRVAAAADEVYLVTAGIPIKIK